MLTLYLTLPLLTLFSLFHIQTCSQTYYSHKSLTYRNQSWMSYLDNGISLRQMTILGSHSSMGTGTGGDAFQTQASTLRVQLESGIRALDIRCRHYYNTFTIHDRFVYLRVTFDQVLDQVKQYLTDYPTETVIVHVVEEYSSSGNSRTFQQTFLSYYNNYTSVIWNVTTQNPTLGQLRGKIVILQQFTGSVYGLLYSSFTSIAHKSYSTNWDQYDRWVAIKAFILASQTAKTSRVAFWTGHVGSFPYFCASGKSSPSNSASRLSTGATTPAFSSYYPDFPRVSCFIGICTIAFQGINILASKYLISNSYYYIGITFVDFAGDVLVQNSILSNSYLFGKCTTLQKSKGCSSCSLASVCLSCQLDMHYIYNSNTYSCDAESGYYLDTLYVPQLCESAINGCLMCESATQCTLCDVFLNFILQNGTCVAAYGYYLDYTVSQTPIKCEIDGCYLCSDATTCTQCSSANNFVMDNNNTCVCDSANNFTLYTVSVSVSTYICICVDGLFLSSNNTCEQMPVCPQNNSGCIQCMNNGTCTLCNQVQHFYLSSPYCLCQQGYFYNGTTCLQCNTTQSACDRCISSLICTSCLNNFTLQQGACGCMPQFYMYDSDTCLQCTVGCLICTNQSACTLCDSNSSFYLVGGYCKCVSGTFVNVILYGEKCVPCSQITGCLSCTMSQCIECDSVLGFYLDSTSYCACNSGYYVNVDMGICTQCVLEGCLQCTSIDLCTQCQNNTYYLYNGTCLQTCGDGHLYNLQCDDGNLNNGDGCSSQCYVQNDFTCSGGGVLTASACSYSGKVTFRLLSFVKDQQSNKVVITAEILPNIPIFDLVDYQQAILTSFPIQTRVTKYNTQNGTIQFTFTYTESLNTQNKMSVQFSPPKLLSFYYTPSSSFQLPYTTDNNLALKVYTQTTYKLYPIINYLSYILLGLNAFGFIFGIFVSSKLMAVEMLMVLQVSYMGLLTMDKLEGLLYPFINFWAANGYNQVVEDSGQIQLPTRVTVPGYKGDFLANFNIDFIIILLPFFVGCAVFVISKLKKDIQLRNTAVKICKQLGISILLAIQIHLVVSITLAFKYGYDQIYGIAIGGIVVLMLVIFGVLLVVFPNNFGDYKQFFGKTNRIVSNFYIFVILCRLAVAATVPYMNQNKYGLISAISSLFLLSVLICILRPYNHNLRPLMNNLVMMVTLAIYLSYQINIIAESTFLTTYLPLILIVLLLVCTCVNIILLFVHKFCPKLGKQSNKAKGDQYIEAMQQSFDNETKRNIQNNEITSKIMVSQSVQMKQIMRRKQNDVPTMNLLRQIKKDIMLFKNGRESTDRSEALRAYQDI